MLLAPIEPNLFQGSPFDEVQQQLNRRFAAAEASEK